MKLVFLAKRLLLTGVTLCIAACTLLFLKPTTIHASEGAVTYSHQIAPILYANCTTCHHPGGAGPFSLLTYQDARRWAAQIVTVTGSNYMPPWLPEPGYGEFADNRRMAASDITLLRRWVQAGMPAGDLAHAPAAPVYSGEWQLGTPDLVLSMPVPFTAPASGTDIFRNFILPYPLAVTHFIHAMEMLPAGPGENAASIVHHANLILDRTGSYRKQHPQNWQEGIPGMELVVDAGSTFDPDSHFLFWKPDSPGLIEPAGMEWRLDPGDDLILNMHFKPSGKAETIQARIGLYFSPQPATKHPMLLQLEHDAALDIPPGERAFPVDDQLTLPVAVQALGVYPHAHYLGKDLEAWAILPDGRKKWLVWIKDWDIDRQSIYRYKTPILLPAGTVLHMRYVYDNSAANPRNPHQPPVRVHAGNRSEDEMGHLWLQVLPVDATTDGKDTRLLLEQAWMADRLRKNPKDVMALYNMAAAQDEEGKPSEAIALYHRILEQNPQDARTLTALGAAEETSGDPSAAAATYQQAIASNESANDARYNLARLDLAREHYAEAEQQLRLLIEQNPQDAAAHSELGLARFRQGYPSAAQSEFAQSLAFKDLPDTHKKLAMADAQLNQLDQAAVQLQIALKLEPKDAETHSLLSQVYASENKLDAAIGEQQAALALEPGDADGWNNLGVFEARSDHPDKARQAFKRALSLTPGFTAAADNLRRLDSSDRAVH